MKGNPRHKIINDELLKRFRARILDALDDTITGREPKEIDWWWFAQDIFSVFAEHGQTFSLEVRRFPKKEDAEPKLLFDEQFVVDEAAEDFIRFIEDIPEVKYPCSFLSLKLIIHNNEAESK